MMKYRLSYILKGILIIWIGSLMACQKAHLVEELPDKSEDTGGRNEQTSQNESTTTVTPDFDVNGCEGAIDAGFTFGGEG